MPITYPPAVPTISGDTVSINRFLQSPTLITRRLRTLLENRFISDVLLTGRYDAQGGAVMYEQSESIYTDRVPEAVYPGGEYPMTGAGNSTAAIAAVLKWGQDIPVTDEAIKRLMMDPVNRAMIKLVNQLVKKIDSITLAAITSAVTATSAASAAWTAGGATILRDIMKAIGDRRALNQGYDPDTLVVNDLQYALVMSDPTVTNALMRERADNPIYSGEFPTIAGLRVLPTANSPSANPLILDTKVLGGMADENLGGPGYTGAMKGVESKSIRQDQRDRWLLRARRVTVPVVIEPAAGIAITGT